MACQPLHHSSCILLQRAQPGTAPCTSQILPKHPVEALWILNPEPMNPEPSLDVPALGSPAYIRPRHECLPSPPSSVWMCAGRCPRLAALPRSFLGILPLQHLAAMLLCWALAVWRLALSAAIMVGVIKFAARAQLLASSAHQLPLTKLGLGLGLACGVAGCGPPAPGSAVGSFLSVARFGQELDIVQCWSG